MQEVFQFIVDNWQFFSSIAISIVGFILLLLKKRYKVVDSAIEYLMSITNQAIREAERYSSKGQKKQFALDFIQEKFVKHFPLLQWKNYESYCSFLIEDTLDTPQKKPSNLWADLNLVNKEKK